VRDITFTQLLREQGERGRLACVGLDPEMATVRQAVGEDDVERALVRFNGAVIDATADLACAYKPNIAFYERGAHTASGPCGRPSPTSTRWRPMSR